MKLTEAKNIIKKLIEEQFRGAPGGTTAFGKGTNTFRKDAQRFRYDFKSNLLNKFGPPGANRISQIQKPQKEQAKSFISKRIAALQAKMDNLPMIPTPSGQGQKKQSPRYQQQLHVKMQILDKMLDKLR